MFRRFLRRLRGDPNIPPVALVALETTFRVLSPGQIAGAIGRATGRDYDSREVTEDGPMRHRFVVESFEYTILTVPRPYMPKDPKPDRDLTLTGVIEAQEAAVLLDCWAAPKGRSREESTDLMGRILVELFDETTVGVYCFHTQRLNPANDRLVAMFRNGQAKQAMEGMTYSVTYSVSAGDSRMAAATEEARHRWPELVAAFDRRQADDAGFGVKARFAEDDWVEHMWLEVEEVDFEKATGRLISQPAHLRGLRQGDRLTVPLSRISDWGYRDGEATGGGFTDSAVREGKEI